MDHQTQATQKEIPDDVSEAGSDMSCSSATSGVSVYSFSSKVRQTGLLCIKLKTDLKRGASDWAALYKTKNRPQTGNFYIVILYINIVCHITNYHMFKWSSLQM